MKRFVEVKQKQGLSGWVLVVIIVALPWPNRTLISFQWEGDIDTEKHICIVERESRDGERKEKGKGGWRKEKRKGIFQKMLVTI